MAEGENEEGRNGEKLGKWKEEKGKGKKYTDLCLENKANIPYQKLARLKGISIQFYLLIKIDINIKNSGNYIISFFLEICVIFQCYLLRVIVPETCLQ